MSAKTATMQKIKTVFQEIQHSRLTHQRNYAVLLKLYDAVSFEVFILCFMTCIQKIFNHDFESKYVLSCITFAAGFVVKVMERDEMQNDSEDVPTPPLLRRMIIEVLKYHEAMNYKQRYHACNFITILLNSISENANLDNDLCDEIQDAMLHRIHDQKTAIREMSVEALQRLQDNTNAECPVIMAYLNSLKDPCPKIRAAVIKAVAPCISVIPKIVESVHDENAKVRLEAFTKLAQLKPTYLTINDRQAVLQRGFEEDDKQASKVFREVLLEKWLAAYEGNYMLLLKSIKLDADEQDIENTIEISNNIMERFLKTHPIMDLLSYLPLDEHKLIPHDKLLTEVASFWNVMFCVLSKREECEEVLTMIVPDLLPFCKYVKKYITENQTKDLDMWEFLNYQFILLKLFDMIQKFDMSDEAGRKVLHQLVTETLLKCCLGKPVISTLLSILEKLSPDTDSLIEEVIDIIRNVLNPIVEVQPSKEDMQELNFMLAELDVKINIQYEEVEEAIAVADMKLAYEKEVTLKLLKAQKADLKSKIEQPRQEKRHSNNPAFKYKPLDILNSLLELKSVTKIKEPLKLFGKEMLAEMDTFVDVEHRKRAFKSHCLYALLDRECAQEYLEIIYTPVLLYRSLSGPDIATMQMSMKTICDLLIRYGPKLFKPEESDSSSSISASKRRLYNPDISKIEGRNNLECSAEYLLDIISMLINDVPEIKETTCEVLARLVYRGVCVSSEIFSRVLIEWSNPVNARNDLNIRTMFGVAMFSYANKNEASQEVISNSVIPALSLIGNAPKTSPLANINVDQVVSFICNLTRPLNRNSIVDTHKTLACILCNTLDKDLEDKCAIIWVKMLLSLEPPHNDRKTLEELKCQVEGLLEDIMIGVVKKKLNKYLSKLIVELDRVTATELEVNSNIDVTSETTDSQQNEQHESSKRPASGSDCENCSPKNPKKKTKLSGVAEQRITRNSVKRGLNGSLQEGDARQEEKRQRLHDSISTKEGDTRRCLQNCINSREEVEVSGCSKTIESLRSDKSAVEDTNGINKKKSVKQGKLFQVHDKENVIQRDHNQKKTIILSNIIIKQTKVMTETAQPSGTKTRNQNNDIVTNTRVTRSKSSSSKSSHK